MNKSCCFILCISFLLANEVLYFIIDALILFLSPWFQKSRKIKFCIYFSFACVRFIQFCVLFILKCNNKYNRLRRDMFIVYSVLYFIFITVWHLFIIYLLITMNFLDYQAFLPNCPYIIKDLEYDLHVKKRCELYNIYNNSRYSYQYICSFDSSKDKYNENIVICIPYKNIINNDIINNFIKEYKDEQNFLCHRRSIPEFENDNYKYCSEKKRKEMYALLILAYLRILVIYSPFCNFTYLKEDIRRNNLDLDSGDLDNISTKSSNVGEESNGNRNFVKQNTINIIIENKEIFIINTNIKNMESNNIKNSIDLNEGQKGISINSANTFSLNSGETLQDSKN